MISTKRIGTITFIVAAIAASSVSHAKPGPGSPLNATVCSAISGVWTTNTCTIPEGTSGVASSSFKIGDATTLEIRGSLTINRGVIVSNSGTIMVANAAGVIPDNFDPWQTGVLIFGALDNSGAITVANAYDEINHALTEGITVSVSLDSTGVSDPTPYVAVPGALTNSGTITIQNGARTRGIKVLGILANSASGTIKVENTGATSVGIYNRRDGPSSDFGINGLLTNAGRLTISSSGESALTPEGRQFGYGIYNQGIFTNFAPGIFTMNPSPVDDDSRALFNGGSFTNYGTFTNDRGVINYSDPENSNWGSFNIGTMINYGATFVGTTPAATPPPPGTFLNLRIMINLGTIISQGIFYDMTSDLTMINYGTLYNYGLIAGGVNHGVCIDETSTNPSAGGC